MTFYLFVVTLDVTFMSDTNQNFSFLGLFTSFTVSWVAVGTVDILWNVLIYLLTTKFWLYLPLSIFTSAAMVSVGIIGIGAALLAVANIFSIPLNYEKNDFESFLFCILAIATGVAVVIAIHKLWIAIDMLPK